MTSPRKPLIRLIYNQDDNLQQTTVIPSGQTLTIASSVGAGSPILYVGSTTAVITSTTAVIAAIQGTDLTSALDLTRLRRYLGGTRQYHCRHP